MPIPAALYDTKGFEREAFATCPGHEEIEWSYLDFRLSAETAFAAEGCLAVCAFVNDELDERCIERLKEVGVELIALRCAGFNNVDIKAADRAGIAVARVPAYSPYAVAEYTVALLMTLNRKIHRSHNRVREHNFSLNGLVGRDLFGKTVGIVGTGRIGQIAAQIFRGFGCVVLAHDPYPSEDWARDNGVTYVSMDELLGASDVISLHLPLTPETMRIIDEESLAKMKPGAFLINTGRGRLISTRALIQALKEERLGGVALDVYEEEEGVFFEDFSESVLKDDELVRLITFPNVLVTSHQAFLTHEALAEIARVTTDSIRRVAAGEALDAVCVVK
ncbi:MAG: 2-hydroxyacid dehydrogenase [Verrucomicrobiota bacterium]